MPSHSSKRNSWKRKQKQRHAPVTCLLPPEIPEAELEISDEDIGYVTQHCQYAGFISNLDTSTITKQVLGFKATENEGESLEVYYEKKAKHMLSSRDEDNQAEFMEPANVLPIKTLSGELQYPISYPEQAKGNKETPLSVEKKQAFMQNAKPAAVSQRTKLSVGSEPDLALKVMTDTEGRKVNHKRKQKRAERMAEQNTNGEAVLSHVPQVLQTSALEELRKDISEEERLAEVKAHMAELARAVLADPENNMESLKELQDLCSDKNGTISVLAMLSLLAVFQDIVPGYRIRIPTQKELEMQVSKEIKKLRQYEANLLSLYQKYLKTLTSFIKSGTHLKPAIQCLCGLLQAVPHFNYRESLLAVVVPQMDSADSVCRTMSCNAVKALFQNEAKHGGDATVEAVQMIADLVKTNACILRPDVGQVLLALSFDDDLNRPASELQIKGMNENVEKFKSKHQMKKDNKAKKHQLAAKLREEVMADFKESSALPDVSKRRRLQTQTLSAVFETYFRILKASSVTSHSGNDPKARRLEPKVSEYGPRALLRPCLDGLGKFSHLISVEFMGDLIGVLKRLAAGAVTERGDGEQDGSPLTFAERLLCCVVAFRIVRSNLNALTVDLHDFYISFYNILLSCKFFRDEHNGEVLADALQVMLCESRLHDMQRVAAFSKRLASLSLQLGPAEAMAALVTIQHLLQHHKRCRNLLENDGDGGSSGFNLAVLEMDVIDPDLSGALSSVLWEVTVLSRHYHPAVAKLASQISTMTATSEGSFLATVNPKHALLTYSTSKGDFYPSVKPPKRTVATKSYVHQNVTFNAMFPHNFGDLDVRMSEEEAGKMFVPHFKYLRDIRENEMLRKDLRRVMRSTGLFKKFRASKFKHTK